MAKFIFITGGVVSGIGKGISAASIGRLLKDNGFSVFMQKFDPYLNVDPGTMSPYQHGEVYVTKDGAETDLDLGHYERFIDVELTKNSSVTSGRIYDSVLNKEREGAYGGNTVQVIPHVTNEIKAKVYLAARESQADVIITEIGGTVGDIESQPFLEAIRQIHSENEKNDVLFVHTTLVPTIPASNELKTKPTQHSFKELMSLGIKPDIFILRADLHVDSQTREKISLFCDVPVEAIVQSENVDLIYEVPLGFRKQGLDKYLMKKLNLVPQRDDSNYWSEMIDKFKSAKKNVSVAIVGKYVKLHDSYISISQALADAGFNKGAVVDIKFVDSEELTEDKAPETFKGIDGILIPGGFGERGIEGMIIACNYARTNDIPYFGICLGMQIAAIEFARNELKIENANSQEFNPDAENLVIHLMESQKKVEKLGATQRLGDYSCRLNKDSKAFKLYKKDEIVERHRHRYEFNNDYREKFEEKGMLIAGKNEEKDLVEIIEYSKNKFHLGCQFHPEFKSRPNNPHPIFLGFIESLLK